MGGVAALARAAGHKVTGCDLNVYPPMSTQLKELNIDIHEGIDADQLSINPDRVIVGNAMSRGSDVVEAMLNNRHRYTSGPEWLAEQVLHDRHIIAVSGTHGKTTTASMLAWILEDAGLEPGFLIGGVPINFGTSARFGKSKFFVVEADEYDTAFFDKRAKFVHYRPQTLVLNNLEFDHADIYKDIDAILWQFHQLLRMVPGNGSIIIKEADKNLKSLLDMGCWTPVQTFGAWNTQNNTDWDAKFSDKIEQKIGIRSPVGEVAETRWQMGGYHNLDNAMAAVAAAVSVGVKFEHAVDALSRFEGVKRRMEQTATVAEITIYDDFAHHPTAIEATIASMRQRYMGHRIVVAIELRSNTMKLGVHNNTLANSLKEADLICMYRPEDMSEDLAASLESLNSKLMMHTDYDELVSDMSKKVLSGDKIVFMSNGDFGSARQKLSTLLQKNHAI
jgi:UDP-N-acetylmuramate: L-alanyl-gamma-D-glutamyl-meso-diaminopimelate ligase